MVVARGRKPESVGDSQANDSIVARVLETKRVICETQTVPREELLREGEDLAERARIKIRYTPHAKPSDKTEEASGMMIKAAAPVLSEGGELLGILYGGHLLNRDFEAQVVESCGESIVDKVKSIVYRREKYKGKDTGTATILQGDLRISTNVMEREGKRAIGTRVLRKSATASLAKGSPGSGELLW